MNSILIIAHAPFAHAMRQCALHVFPDCEQVIAALDVLPNVSPEETLAAARITLAQQLRAPRAQVLVLADVFGLHFEHSEPGTTDRLWEGVVARHRQWEADLRRLSVDASAD